MATFSQNQVRHLYVAKEFKTPKVISTDLPGAISVHADTAKSTLYFEYMGVGGIHRTDLVSLSNLISASATDASKLVHPLRKDKIVLDPSINAGLPVAGQDYTIKIQFRNYIGLSEEDQYTKFGMAHAYSGMSASAFYKELAISLAKNFSKDEEGLLKIFIEEGGTDPKVEGNTTVVTRLTKTEALTGTYTGIIVEELPQEWILGTFPQIPVNYTILPSTIVCEGDDRIWGLANKLPSTSYIKNGKNIADLEYFCMGNRGDIYRMMGFPNVIRTTYLADPSLEYNTIDLHYSYIGSNESVQKSEKTLTIVVPKVGANNKEANKLTNSIITALNTAAGLTIPLLDESE